MSQFLAFMLTRVPRSVEAAREMERTLSLELLKDLAGRPDDLRANLERYEAETGDHGGLTTEEAVEAIQRFDERFILEVGDRHPLMVSLGVTPAVVEQLLTMSWCICDAGRVPVLVEKKSGAFFRLVKCTTNTPPARAATGGTRHGQGYQGKCAGAGA